MRITNVHQRVLPVGGAPAESLIDGLAGDEDRLWPSDRWPPMRFAGGLREGSTGGHGPIGYRVIEHRPGCCARFGFTAPEGLVGEHAYELEAGERTVLRHTLTARAEGRMRWQWPLLFEPLHDALIEDSLDHALAAVRGVRYEPARWPRRTRILRWLLKGLM
jgi:hypothetical protein